MLQSTPLTKKSLCFSRYLSVGLAILLVGLPLFSVSAEDSNTTKLVNENFSDVSFTAENSEAIEYLKEKDVVDGYSDGTFKPDNKINRAEFTKIIIGAKFDQETIDSCIEKNVATGSKTVFFPDVPRDAWFAPFVCVAKTKGIISGYPDGTFKPENNISFAEEAKIIVNTFGFEVEAGDNWYEGFVRKMDELNAIPRTVESFTEAVDRGEMAESVYRIDADDTDKISPSFEEIETWSEVDTISGLTLTKLPIEDDWNNTWFTDGADVYYRMGSGKNGDEFVKLVGADPHTFKNAGGEYMKDSKSVYYLYIRMENVDSVDNFHILRNSYATDGSKIYFLGSVIASGAEATSFQALDDITAKSSQHIFYNGRVIDQADLATFTLIPGPADPAPTWSLCGKDSQHIFCEGLLFQGVDVNSFSYVTSGLAKDNNGVYCGNGRLASVDPASLEVIESANRYIKDANHVYLISWGASRSSCSVEVLSGVNPATFNGDM